MKSVSTSTTYPHGRLDMDFTQDLKIGDKVTNIFTKEIGTIVEIRGEDLVVCYNSFWFDFQKRHWIRPVQRYVN
jgi:hypothetical protein